MLELEVKRMIIEVLQREDLTLEAIDTDAPLFCAGLDLDSLDALEISIALQERYGVTLPDDALTIQEHLSSVRAMAALILRAQAT